MTFSGDERVELEFEYLLESLRKDTDKPRDLGDCGASLVCEGCSEFGDELLKTGDVFLEFELLLMLLPGLFIGECMDFSEEEFGGNEATNILKRNSSLVLNLNRFSLSPELESEESDLFLSQSLFEFCGIRTIN